MAFIYMIITAIVADTTATAKDTTETAIVTKILNKASYIKSGSIGMIYSFHRY